MTNRKVFLSYSRRDENYVQRVFEALSNSEGVGEVFKDDRSLPPGAKLASAIGEALDRTDVVLVFYGERIGPYQEKEIGAVLSGQTKHIPVRLPGGPEIARLSALERDTNAAFFVEKDFEGCLEETDNFKRLLWGVTGKNPFEDDSQTENRAQGVAPMVDGPEVEAAALVEGDEAEEPEVEDLVEVLEHGPVTVFVGTLRGGDAAGVPSAGSISRDLLSKLQCVGDGDTLLPPLDLTCYYYSLQRDDDLTEVAVKRVIAGQTQGLPASFDELARLLEAVARRKKARGRTAQASVDDHRQLIVTSNLDLRLERALLDRGLGFTRVVQSRRSPHQRVLRVRFEEHWVCFEPAGFRVPRSETCSLIREITAERQMVPSVWLKQKGYDTNPGSGELDLETLPFDPDEILLYKLGGSQDVLNSCAMTAEHLVDLARNGDELIPDLILGIVRSTPSLFFGFSFIDPYFRLILGTLLREQDGTRFALQERPTAEEARSDRKIEARLWKSMIAKAGIRFRLQPIEAPPERVFEAVRRRLETS